MALLIVAGLVAAGAAGWSVRSLLAPPDPLPPPRSFSVVSVTQGVVQRSLSLTADAEWSGGPDVVNRASGTLTSRIASSGERVDVGDALFSVDLEPVVVAEGAVPAFRLLKSGARGEDVRQLQRMLAGVGVAGAEPDGVFGAQTTKAVREWQRSMGRSRTGEVALGAVVFLPRLPGTFAWDKSATVGSQLSVGSPIGRMLPKEPVFTMTLPQNQQMLIETGMDVEIAAGSGRWLARLGELGQAREDGAATVGLVPAKGETSICGDQCSDVPVAGARGLRAQVIVVPARSGAVVPVSALAVGADGSSAVVPAEGATVPVKVLASAGGQALVTGVDVGVRVRAPATTEASP